MKTARRNLAAFGVGAGALLLILILILAFAVSRGAEEQAQIPSSPEEKLMRDAVHAFDPTQPTLLRLRSVSRSLKSLKGLPRSRREEMVATALLAGVNGNLDAFRQLPESEKAERAELLYRDAVRTRNYFLGLSDAKRRRARELLYSDSGGKEEMDHIMHTILNTLTPEERKMLNPVFMVWKNTLEER